MKSILLSIIMITLLSVPFKAISEIYQWTDEDGNVHFSDRTPSTEKLNKQDVPPEEAIFNEPAQAMNKTTSVNTATYRKMLKLPDGSDYPIPRSEAELKKYKDVLKKIEKTNLKTQRHDVKEDHQSSSKQTKKIENNTSDKKLTTNKKSPITSAKQKQTMNNMTSKTPIIENTSSIKPSSIKETAKNKTSNKQLANDKNLPITSGKQKQTIKNMTRKEPLIKKVLPETPPHLKETAKNKAQSKKIANNKSLPTTLSRQKETIKDKTSNKQLAGDKNLPITSSKQKQTIKNMTSKTPPIKKALSATPSNLKKTVKNKMPSKKVANNKRLPTIPSIQKKIDNSKTIEPFSEANKYLEMNKSKTIYGPARVKIKNSAYMDIIYGQAFIPEDVTREVFKLLGQDTTQLAGAIVPGIPGDKKLKDNWGMIAIKVNDNGHIFDDKAENTDFSELLNSIKKSNQENTSNTHSILDWIREPIYNAKIHALSFSFNVLDNSNNYQDIYQIFLLGRTELITFIYAADTKDRYLREPFVNQVMHSIKYEAGHQYEDYEPKTDHLSKIELSNLITGNLVVVKKIGLLSVALDILSKFWKNIILLIVLLITVMLILFKLCIYSINPKEKEITKKEPYI